MSDKNTILYVDDEPLNIMLFTVNFKKQFNVITGKSGMEGLELLKKNPEIKSVISDMKMPGMNGIEFITQAKDIYPDINYYILTGYDITPEMQAALRNKIINKYFSKPINFKEIEEAINSGIGY
jgi:response regulator RpfG family c-di-GMP phosphodiesterase